jgi:hypothetical protein
LHDKFMSYLSAELHVSQRQKLSIGIIHIFVKEIMVVRESVGMVIFELDKVLCLVFRHTLICLTVDFCLVNTKLLLSRKTQG